MLALNLKTPIIVALDVNDPKEAIILAQSLRDFVGAYKIGPRLLLRSGGSLIKDIADMAPVFVDQKFYDIPNTMIGAIQACFDQGATFVTIHASSGETSLKLLSSLEKKLQKIRTFHILSVTILTSFSSQDLISNMKDINILDHVKMLVNLTVRSGLNGIVCSPHEASEIRKMHAQLNIITPGVRIHKTQNTSDDQKRIMTPKEAIASGASALVIGRPIICAEDPKAVAQQILNDII